MHKRATLLLLLHLLILSAFAQLQSPEQFLGYRIGTHYTPHARIVDYFKHIAAAKPDMVHLTTYGQTNEGRPLIAAFISDTKNISNLEAIRQNNLSLARLADGAGSTTAPAIVWLSYNVHGNEPSSSEAAMLTLYSLVDPNNTRTKAWLQNTVVVIDPCLNPDGRDRYVNWYNSVAGKNYNPQLVAREHNEPWPGGRVNHYYFDLNRDWAWQTQIETQQRLAIYNSWLPQIHVDFHEQDINSPYYFAPAAQPYHEVITPWQRSFQETIGRNHAKYFDEKGWLYFTKEIFDLFYPSYGDTYPLYNGSIGMTYEQAGGPAGGLGALTNIGDTLTLEDRAQHHLTTSLSTIEVASQNATKLLTEFHNFYQSALTSGSGKYNSYVIKYSPEQSERINALTELLTRNKIRFGSGKAATARGFNYDTGKEERFDVSVNDLVIPAEQPKSALLRVLFEPDPKLVDSATYDITAWALPYVYGLNAYASTEHLQAGAASAALTITNPAADPYGYIVRWNGMSSVKLAAQLLKHGIRVRYSQKPFVASGQSFERGSLIILKTGNTSNANLWNTVSQLANENKVQLTPVTTGFVEKGFDFGSSNVHALQMPKVAVLSGEGVSSNSVGEVWHYFDQTINYPVTLVSAADFSRMDLSQFNVLILPNGSYKFLNDKPSTDQLQNWINKGGKLIAMESAVTQLSKLDWSIKARKNEDTSEAKNYDLLRRYEDRERSELPNVTPGAIFRVTLDNTHPLAFGYPDHYYTLKQDDKNYEFIKEGGWNVGVIKKDKQIAGFVGCRLQSRIRDALVFGVQDMGNGSIVYLTDDVLFRSFWENGKLLFSNAVFFVGQ